MRNEKHRYRKVKRMEAARNGKPYYTMFDPNTGVHRRSSELIPHEKPGIFLPTDREVFAAGYPELMDIGIMGRCVCAAHCNVGCYQNAQLHGENMSLENFESLLRQSREKTLQVALGGAGDPDTHENFLEILEICAKYNIVPNFTTSGIALTDEAVLEGIYRYCGAVAVSEHDAPYTKRAVECLLAHGIKTNMHYVLNRTSIVRAAKILNGTQPYHEGINAIVFLLQKPVGRADAEECLSYDRDYPLLKEFFEAFDNRQVDFKIGFDSCTSTALINFSKKFNRTCIDFCEAARFSMYISADMQAMPCSFMNQQRNLHVQLKNLTGNVDGKTIQEAWDSEAFEAVRTRLGTRCMGCKDRVSCGGGCPALDRVALCDRRERYEDNTGSCYEQQQ